MQAVKWILGRLFEIPYPYDERLYRQRHNVENLFARLKDWWRIGFCCET